MTEPPETVIERNVLGGAPLPCGTDPGTGFYRDGDCRCAAMVTPRPGWQFPGLVPGDRWCVVAARWLQAHEDGAGTTTVKQVRLHTAL